MSFNKNVKSDSILLLKHNYNWLKAIGITSILMIISFIPLIIELPLYRFNYEIFHNPISNIVDMIDSVFFRNSYNISFSSSALIFTIISIIFYLIYYLLFSVFEMGFMLWNFKTIYKENNEFITIFYYFSSLKNILKSLFVSLQIFIRKIIWTVIIFLPPTAVGSWAVIATIYQNKITNKFLIPFGYILAICLLIASSITCIIFFQRYILTRYLIVSGECQKIREAIKLSIKIMSNKKMDYILLILSFFFWIISCIFIIPIFFVYPYIKISITLYSRYVIEDYFNNKDLENIKSS